MSELLSTTVAQAIAWLIAFGIAGAVAYVLGWFPNVPASVKNIVATVTVAALVAIVTALASFIPPTWLDMKILDAVIALVALVFSGAGWKFGAFKVVSHRAELQLAVYDLKMQEQPGG